MDRRPGEGEAEQPWTPMEGMDRQGDDVAALGEPAAQAGGGTKTTHTTCPYCGVGCGVLAEVTPDGTVSVRGDPTHPARASARAARRPASRAGRAAGRPFPSGYGFLRGGV